MRPPRLTIRRLMILVAFLGICFGVGVLVRRSNDYRRQAERYEQQWQRTKNIADHYSSVGAKGGAAAYRRKEQAEERLAQRFRAAQRRPWLGVPVSSGEQ